MFDETFVRAWRLYLAGLAGGVHDRDDAVVPGGVRARERTTRSRGRAAAEMPVTRQPMIDVRRADRRRRTGGLDLRWALARAGLDVVVMDRARRFRATRCAPAGSRRRSSTR